MNGAQPQESPGANMLQALAAACSHRAFYPPDHPLTGQAMTNLTDALESLLRQRETVVFQVFEDTFFLDDRMLADASLRNVGLLETCLERSVGVIAVQPGVTALELDALVSLLIEPVIAIQGAGGAQAYLVKRGVQHITIEPPRTGRPSEFPAPAQPEDAYEAGHAAAQELRAQAARRQPLDLEKARVFISAAMEVVLENRFPLLGQMTTHDYDEHSSHHAVNVTMLALLVGIRLDLDHAPLMALGMGALLHDIGKVRVPQELLTRVGLSSDEQRVLQRHPIHGARILRDLGGFGPIAAMCALEHHVHYDLSGYPTLRHKTHPHPFSSIVAVADAYDTITAARKGTYRAFRPELAMKWIAAGLGTLFDPVVGRVFIRMMGLYPVGSLVELGTGRLAIVLRPSEQFADRPLVRLISEKDNASKVIDLAVERSEVIGAGVDPEDVGVNVHALLDAQRNP